MHIPPNLFIFRYPNLRIAYIDHVTRADLHPERKPSGLLQEVGTSYALYDEYYSVLVKSAGDGQHVEEVNFLSNCSSVEVGKKKKKFLKPSR